MESKLQKLHKNDKSIDKNTALTFLTKRKFLPESSPTINTGRWTKEEHDILVEGIEFSKVSFKRAW